MQEIIINAAVLIGAPILRSVSGWAEHALKDKKVTSFEWKQLAETIVRVGMLGVMGFIGFSLAGVDNAAMAGAVSGYLADILFRKLESKK